MKVGEIIQHLRDEKGLNQKELAEKVGLSYSVMNRIELGTRPVRDEELKKIAEVLDTTIDYLLGASDIRNPYEENAKFTKTDKFLKQLKYKAIERGIEFDEESVDDLLDLYAFLKDRDKKSN